MEQGDVEKRIITNCLRDRQPIPKRIVDAPALIMGLELYFGAWVDLDPDRPSGWDIRPIPWSSISDYAAAFGIEGEQREDLFFLVRAMDNAYIKYQRAQSEKKRKK